MKTREEEEMENMEAGEILRVIPLTVIAVYIGAMLYPIFSAFYALGTGIAVLATGLWLSHLYRKRDEKRFFKKREI